MVLKFSTKVEINILVLFKITFVNIKISKRLSISAFLILKNIFKVSASYKKENYLALFSYVLLKQSTKYLALHFMHNYFLKISFYLH